MTFRHFFGVSLFLYILPLTINAQIIDSFDPSGNISPSVETFEMTKYGMISPSMYTGAMSFSVPLYTYKDQDFTIPISLDYNFDGYRPGMHSGTVGYGWTLNCGGVITREVRGYPDEGPVQQSVDIIGWAQAKAQGIHYNDSGIRSSSYALDMGPYGRDALIDKTFPYDPLSEIPVFVTIGGVKCDPAPDLFHFSFCGYNGDFMIREDGSIRAYNTNVPFGELAITFTPGVGSPNFAEIVIRTGDGTRYYFGGSIDCVETFHSRRTSSGARFPKPASAGFGFYDNDVSTQVTAFRLYKIESPAPSSRKVLFNYSSQRQKQRSVTESYRTVKSYGYLYNGIEYNGGGMPDEDATYIGVTYCSPLTSISVDDGVDISFSYQNKASDEEDASCYHLSYINNYVLNPIGENISPSSKRLSHILAQNSSSQTVFSCTLTQNYAGSGTPKMFLQEISNLNSGKFAFTYNTNGFYLPKNDTKNTDHWGYWNGKYVSGIRNILKTSNGYPVSDLYDQISGTSKEADNAYSKCGALIAITYPTGGTTGIEYEGNTVSRRITNYSGTVATDCTPYEVGGVRVKKLSHSAGVGSGMEDSVSYIYSDTKTGQTSGVLNQMPRYAAAYYFSYYTGSASVETFSCDETAISYSSSNGFPSRDGHIGYGTVIEVYEDGSWKKHTFSTAAQIAYSDDKDYDEEDINKQVFGPYDSMTASVSTPLRHPVTVDRKNMRGQLLRTDLYDALDSLKKTVAMAYVEDMVTLDTIYFNRGSYFGRMHWSARSPLLSSKVETTYENGGSMTVSTAFSHNAFGQIMKETVNGGALAGAYSTYYRYEWEDYSATPIPAAKTDILKTRTIGNTEWVTFKERYLYSITNIRPSTYTQYSIPVPPVFSSWMLTAVSFGDGNPFTATFTYDSQNRLTGADLPGGYSIQYTWDGNNIIAKTEQGDKITGYLWKDYIGLTGITSPSGMTESYEYDSHNRPWKVLDANGNTISVMHYHLLNEQ